MNNKEASINKVDELVNRAQLAINDWQCSGDVDCLEKAAAYLRAALLLKQSSKYLCRRAQAVELLPRSYLTSGLYTSIANGADKKKKYIARMRPALCGGKRRSMFHG